MLFSTDTETAIKMFMYLRLTDLGETWASLATDSIKTFARTITEDFVNPNLLFLGTEYGLYISIDGGKEWVRFEGKVPKVPIYEMVIHPTENDLVIATHGRGILIIDDIEPLRLLSDQVLSSELTIFPSETYTITNPKFTAGPSGDQTFFGSNPSSSAIISYYMQKRHVFGDMSVEIYNSDGELIKTLAAGKNKGINYVEWAVRKKPPRVKAANPMLAFRTAFGPTFPPGEYTVKIKKGDNAYEGKITLQTDPSTGHSAEDMEMQYETLDKAYSLLEDISFTDRQATDMMEKLKAVKSKVTSEDLKNEINVLYNKLESMHKELVATSTSRISGEVRLAEKVADIYSGVISYAGKPTDSQMQGLKLLSGVYDTHREQMNKILDEDLMKINSELKNLGLEEIKIITREEYDKS